MTLPNGVQRMNNNLKERRQALELRISDVVNLLANSPVKVSYGTLWNYEHDRPGGVILNKYQTVLDLYDRLENEKKKSEGTPSC